MTTTHLDGSALKELFLGGLSVLKLNKDRIDELNVFPVPDGDTGTNMSMTLEGSLESAAHEEIVGVSELMQKVSRGALLSARGNSGVILSQFIKGFGKGCEGRKTISCADSVKAFRAGVEKAYDAVITPTEGTMLTVMREGCEMMESRNFASFQECIGALNARMDESLENTPELLPVLKEAGVIDSGGAGFICIFKGMEKVLNGEKITAADVLSEKKTGHTGVFNADSELEYGYCTEFILQLQHSKVDIDHFEISKIVNYLEGVGDSIVAVKDDDLVKIHVHTFFPGQVLDYCQKFGEFITLKIENMSIQHNETMIVQMQEQEQKKKLPAHKPIAYVAALSGDGLISYFKELGVDEVVNGGQTDNPSAEDFVKAYENLNADTIIVLPCNSNIVMAAGQSAEIYQKADVRVVPAKSVAEGYAAISIIDVSCTDPDRIIRDMEYAVKNAGTGLITTATRDMTYKDITVQEGHYIGLDRDDILSDSPDKLTAVKDMLNAMEDISDKEVLTIFYGKHVTDEERSELAGMLDKEFSWLEYGFIYGGQEVYDYIFTVE